MTNTEKNVEIAKFYLGTEDPRLFESYSPKFDTDWNWLHKAWDKFRDLTFDEDSLLTTHSIKCLNVSLRISHHPISEAFEALYEGVLWYNNLNK